MTVIVKFPYCASRRVHSRRHRISKNGTPEERAAKAAAVRPDRSTAPNVIQISPSQSSLTHHPSPEESAYFRSLLDQLDPWELAEVADMVRSPVEKPSRR
jgi:hypothetical protein